MPQSAVAGRHRSQRNRQDMHQILRPFLGSSRPVPATDEPLGREVRRRGFCLGGIAILDVACHGWSPAFRPFHFPAEAGTPIGCRSCPKTETAGLARGYLNHRPRSCNAVRPVCSRRVAGMRRRSLQPAVQQRKADRNMRSPERRCPAGASCMPRGWNA